MALLGKEKTHTELKVQEDWFAVRKIVKNHYNKRPDINAILFLIGINELGFVKDEWEKEEKQDLMHVAICVLFPEYYVFEKKDEDNWPHFIKQKELPNMLLKEQEYNLKLKIIAYFKKQNYIE